MTENNTNEITLHDKVFASITTVIMVCEISLTMYFKYGFLQQTREDLAGEIIVSAISVYLIYLITLATIEEKESNKKIALTSIIPMFYFLNGIYFFNVSIFFIFGMLFYLVFLIFSFGFCLEEK